MSTNPVSDHPTFKILVIDDTPAALSMLAKHLEDHGYHVAVAEEGEEAIQRARIVMPDLVLLDVLMPGVDGFETCRRLKADESTRDIPVIFMTALTETQSKITGFDVGGVDFVTKPIQLEEVLARVRTHLTLHALQQKLERRTEELSKSEERFRLITECAADLISIIDAEGRRLFISPSHEKVLGYSREELKSISVLEHVHPEDRDRLRAAIRRNLEEGAQDVIEYRYQHKNGGWLDLESYVVPFRRGENAPEGLLVVTRDVSERKQAERERQQLEIQLRQRQKLEAIGQLAAGIAHEINTPIQYVGDNTRFLQDAFNSLAQTVAKCRHLAQACANGAPAPEVLADVNHQMENADLDYLLEQAPAAIRETLEGVERVAKIVRAMKEFSHPGPKDKTRIDIHKNIENTVTVARNEWKYVADVKTDFDLSLPPVLCFAGEFNQVLLNLVVNAAHAIGDVVRNRSNEKGTITVSTRKNGEWAEVRVADTGTGIPPEVRPHIFEPFFTTKEVGKGTGQGLSTVYAIIVKKHGGEVTFETETGQGTTFIVRLPLGTRPVPPAITAASPSNRKGAP